MIRDRERGPDIPAVIHKPKKPLVVRYFDESIKVEQTALSCLSPLPLCLILTLPELIGTHEATKPEGLRGIDFSHGWNGAPIAVATLNEWLLEQLGEGVHVVENVDYGDFGVLDGHHRRQVAENEGLAYAMTQLIPLISPHVLINTWLENFTPLTPDEVASYFRQPEAVVPAKATKFQVVAQDGTVHRIMEMQPHVKTSRRLLENRL